MGVRRMEPLRCASSLQDARGQRPPIAHLAEDSAASGSQPRRTAAHRAARREAMLESVVR
jgi:hypothetical protein